MIVREKRDINKERKGPDPILAPTPSPFLLPQTFFSNFEIPRGYCHENSDEYQMPNQCKLFVSIIHHSMQILCGFQTPSNAKSC